MLYLDFDVKVLGKRHILQYYEIINILKHIKRKKGSFQHVHIKVEIIFSTQNLTLKSWKTLKYKLNKILRIRKIINNSEEYKNKNKKLTTMVEKPNIIFSMIANFIAQVYKNNNKKVKARFLLFLLAYHKKMRVCV